MSTNDVPGHKPENRDILAMGCWAEHDDGSLILVDAVEGGYVIYSVFDLSETPVMEYRDRMAEGTFKKDFSWDPKKKGKQDKWTWHDKTPFPWDRVIQTGVRGGLRHAYSEDLENAADRVRRHRELHGKAFDYDAELARTGKTGRRIRDKIQDAIRALRS